MTTTFWALLVVAVCAVIAIVVFVMVRNAHRPAPAGYNRSAPQPCVANGHTYRIDGTAWRCAICGNHVPRQEGEVYGPSDEGRVDRRRGRIPDAARRRGRNRHHGDS